MTAPLQRLTLALADRYRIERELGQGGMATVYLAQDLRHDRKVALKVLRPELAAILGGDRFLKEIKTTANLQHPHILSLFDSGEADGMVYYVMPFVQGESLRDRLNREHQLPVEDAVRIAREVADALEYAHGHGVIHRDIKPENILLHGGHAQVADFGIALAVSRSDGGTRMTETGMSLGTPHYMSPEQAMGEREVTAKADIYALGCVLYEMLTAEPPFNGPTAQAIIARVMTEEPRSLTLQRRTIPPHVEAAVVTALSKLPADRFASAALFSAALGNTAFTTTTATRAATAARSPRTKAAAALPWTLLALTAAGLAWALLRPRP
ncbi:MAG TPA: serine/threonine-protein kinase, partial [Gemmatimonadales bacterium]